MENPQVRWVEALPIKQDGRDLFVLKDPEGLVDRSLMVSREALFLISLMDGSRSLRDIQAEFMRTVGRLVQTEEIQAIVDALDQQFLLRNDRFDSHFRTMQEEYEASPCRPSFLAGKSYPATMQELASYLETMFSAHEEHVLPRKIRGILAPHIDYSRGMAVYSKIYPFLSGIDGGLIVLLGTCHHVTPHLINISLKDFATPLGIALNARELGKLIREDRLLTRYVAEWPHRNEHSIELQIPLIQFLMRERGFEILPILTGSMHEYVEGTKNISKGELQDLTGGLKDLLESYGKSYCIIAGADLAHIGAQFGDRYPLERTVLEESKAKDQTLLESVRQIDPEAFFGFVRDEGDRRRICGLTPIYFQLSLMDGAQGKVVTYDQWTDGASSVSFAGAVFYE